MDKKKFEKALKDKLSKTGINKEWLQKNLIIDTISTKDLIDLDDATNNTLDALDKLAVKSRKERSGI